MNIFWAFLCASYIFTGYHAVRALREEHKTIAELALEGHKIHFPLWGDYVIWIVAWVISPITAIVILLMLLRKEDSLDEFLK
ncbi:MAG: hypothetical protein AAB443_03120 [Patescibacteria group bacterium]